MGLTGTSSFVCLFVCLLFFVTLPVVEVWFGLVWFDGTSTVAEMQKMQFSL